MSKKHFIPNKGIQEHSEAKIKLLSEYLVNYLRIMSNNKFTSEIHVFDPFCGPGLYDDTSKGSPLIILDAIKYTYYSQKKINKEIPKVNCYFSDIEQEKVDHLTNTINNNSLHKIKFGELHISTSSYTDQIAKIESIVNKKQNNGFVFIDPCGYKEIKTSDIKYLMKNGKTEVLLWLPIQFMYRFKNKGTPEALANFIKELIPEESIENSKNVWEFITQLKLGFKREMSDYFVDTFTIEKDENTVFCLFFFTPHVRGFEVMIETKWKIDAEEGRGWSHTDKSTQYSMFENDKKNMLEEELIGYIKSGKRHNIDVFYFVLNCGFSPKHATQILVNLQKNNYLEVLLESGEKARRGAFYIKYHKHEKDNKKVFFKMKE